MNLENELNIIQELLKIPLNKIEINGTQIIKIYRAVKIFSYITENKKGYGIIQRRKYYRFF